MSMATRLFILISMTGIEKKDINHIFVLSILDFLIVRKIKRNEKNQVLQWSVSHPLALG